MYKKRSIPTIFMRNPQISPCFLLSLWHTDSHTSHKVYQGSDGVGGKGRHSRRSHMSKEAEVRQRSCRLGPEQSLWDPGKLGWD